MPRKLIDRTQNPRIIAEFYPESIELYEQMIIAYQKGKFVSFMTELLKHPQYQPSFTTISEAISETKQRSKQQRTLETDYFLWIAIEIVNDTQELV